MQTKSCSAAEVKVDIAQRIIEGYASKRNRDLGGDMVPEGAFTKTLQERGLARIKVMREHKGLIGKPLHAEEDSQGLFTRSKISETPLGEETLRLAADGVLDGMSIGYDAIPDKTGYVAVDGKQTRMLREVKLYEWSFVPFPMNDQARVTAVKNLHDVAEMFHAMQFLEDMLRDGTKLTPEEAAQAAAILERMTAAQAALKTLLQPGSPTASESSGSELDPQVVSSLQSLVASMKLNLMQREIR